MSTRALLPALLLVVACSPPAAPPPSAAPKAAPAVPQALTAPIPKGVVISPTLVIGGQPDAAALKTMAGQGLKTVVNLRPDREADIDHAALAKAHALRYVHIPVAGKAGLNDVAIDALEAVLAAGEPTLVHCASGNRVGALFALHAARHRGASPEEALAVGVRHGLTRLKGVVSERLKASAKPDFAAQAAERVGRFKAALGAELKAALKGGGPAHAIGVCADKAPEIAQKMSDDTMTIRRVGTRVRNTKTNTPTEAMTAVLAELTSDTPVHVGTVDGKQAAVHGLFIQTPVCLSCHGAPGSLGAEVTAALAERYPDDAATGYQMGDLRGAIVVEKR